MTEVTVRPAVSADVAAVVDLWAVAAGPTSLPGDESAVSLLLERDPEALLVAETDGVVVGTLIVGVAFWRGSGFELDEQDLRWYRPIA